MSPRLEANGDPDAAALRRASRTVGLQLALASTVLVLLVVVVAFSYVFAHLKPSQLLHSGQHDSTIDVGAFDVLVAAIGIGVAAIALAGLLSWFATHRAIRPLGEALRLQRDFVSNASHELRTPLAVLDARLQYLQRGLPAGDRVATTVAELRRDTRTLIEIVNDLLVTAEEGGAPIASEPVEMIPVLQLAVDSLSILAEERDVTIALTAPTSVSVQVPPAAIHRCVVALLDNALRFSPNGSTITVTLSVERGAAEVRVFDQGPGISGLEPSQVFERFARGQNDGENAAGASTGYGIGLALVKDTIERAGGTAAVERTGGGGTVMLLRLPKSRRR
ncbi:MAG: HAMP domain-containing histidine kinase [Actinomycetota bacterium]|nr:HAMP domain-containing histidine kinase [Actinomycetota bacterium]